MGLLLSVLLAVLVVAVAVLAGIVLRASRQLSVAAPSVATVEGQRRFRGLMAGYLSFVTRMRYLGSTLRDRIPFLPRPSQAVETKSSWDLAATAPKTT